RQPLSLRRRRPGVSRRILPLDRQRATLADPRTRDRPRRDVQPDDRGRGRFREVDGVPPAGAGSLPDVRPAAGSARRPAFMRMAPSSALESKAFPEGGFYVLRSDRAHVIVDCGEVGMRGRGGHGHNDILSFELWLDRTNLVTDCGAYLYTASREWRNRFRSTA